MSFSSEARSSRFSVPGANIEQTLSQSYDPFSGIDINTNLLTSSFTEENVSISDSDKRISLGCFVFDDDNEFSDKFKSARIGDPLFNQLEKTNLIINGNGRGVESIYTQTSSNFPNHLITPFIPLGDWGYCTYDALANKNKKREDYGITLTGEENLYSESNLTWTSSYEDMSIGRKHIDNFQQADLDGMEFNSGPDEQGAVGYAGYYPYFFAYEGSLLYLQSDLSSSRALLQDAITNDEQDWLNTTADLFFQRVQKRSAGWKRPGDRVSGICPEQTWPIGWDDYYDFGNGNVESDIINNRRQTKVMFPNIAKWIYTPEAYSYGRCLEFFATNHMGGQYRDMWEDKNEDADGKGFFTIAQFHTFDWGSQESMNDNPNDDDRLVPVHNQYRSLNQVCKINNSGINKYTIFELKFKMKTDSTFYNQGTDYPQIEFGFADGDGDLNDPRRLNKRDYADRGFYNTHGYFPEGEFNSQRYDDDVLKSDFSSRYSTYGSMGRFQNKKLDEWEEFSYTFDISYRYHYGNTPNRVRSLYLIIQTAGEFLGRVLIDDIEVIESYDFTPDVDVRKKISVGNYGKADLTKYYDKELQSEEYKDSQAPLEAQFYFYPTYRTDKTFDVGRTPMYRDFKNGLFYIQDVDWGDDSSKEFVTEPKQIDEETALYHTYQQSGVFEITGTMIRMKLDQTGTKPIGVIKNKKFKLKININEGYGTDFKYFASDGFQFIPFSNSTPVIGGYSNQSIYYKTIKRLLGIIDDYRYDIPFKSEGDKLKTQIAFNRMDSSFDEDLKILNAYKEQRVDENNEVIYNGIKTKSDELGKGIGDCDLTNVKYYTEPKSLHELLGFEQEEIEIIGNPQNLRYWKNIIPKQYSIFSRDGLMEGGYINTFSEQDWKDVNADGVPDFYYPVLPKYDSSGKFIPNTYPNNKIPFPIQGPITNENEYSEKLLINITSQKVESNIFDDNSKNQNIGFAVSDFKPKFDNETLVPKNAGNLKLTRTSTTNGAF